jgi:hypothetical protein
MSVSSPYVPGSQNDPALSKPGKANRGWKRAALILLALTAVSLMGNAYQFLRTIPGHEGGGRSVDSPDGQYSASASSHREVNPLHPDSGKLWGRIMLIDHARPQQALCELRIEPPGVEHSGGYRDIENLIAWSDDSQSATITLPHARIELLTDSPTVKK